MNARLKGIGLAIQFSTQDDEAKEYPPDTVVPMEFNGYTIYDKWYKHDMYEDIFALYNKVMRSTTVIEAYRGQKIDIAWRIVLNNEELKQKYPDDLNDETINIIKAATEATIDNMVKIVEEKTKEANKYLNITSEEPQTPKRRGRKPKKKYEDLVNEVLEANRKMEEEDSENYEDDSQDSNIIIDES